MLLSKTNPKLTFFLLVWLLVTSCGKPTNKSNTEPTTTAPSENSPPSSVAKSEEKLPKFSAEWIALEAPNQFKVDLKWSGITSPNQNVWVIQREDKENGRKPIATLAGEKDRFSDGAVAAGGTYSYWLTSPPDSEAKPVSLHANVSITLPRDLEIRGQQKLERITHVYRLFLRAGSTLYSDGKPLYIDVTQLISENSQITTFAENQIANESIDGRPGGTIVIRAERASGHLILNLRGEWGGSGRNGLPGRPGAPGKQGNPGVIGAKAIIHRPAIFGPLPQINRFCVTPPGPGESGENGVPGGIGGSGGRGGDSAKAYVVIQNPSGFKLIPNTLPGKGGIPGPGGVGGPGGQGGPPGVNPDSNVCPNASPGPTGVVGLKGAEGLPGLSGSPLPTCFRLGSANFGDCETFPHHPEQIY